MKLIKTLTDKDIFGKGNSDYSSYSLREAARAVLFDQDGKIAFLNVSKQNYHKLPGGGIDQGENHRQGLERELLEETGCKAEILKEIGEVVEYRDKDRRHQISYCWIAKVIGEKGEVSFVHDEIDDGFELIWVTMDEAMNMLKNDKPKDYQGHFIIVRDLLILEESKKLL